MERRSALVGQLDEGTAPIAGIRTANDEPVGLEIADGLSHRLGADPFGHGEVADALRAVAIESAEDGALREREVVLGAQPAHQLAEHDAQLAREEGRVGLGRHVPDYTVIDRQTAQVACIVSAVNGRPANDRYKWLALSNTTLAVLLATLDASITLIAMPDIFRGIHLDPLVPSNSLYLLWMILGYLVVTSVLIVSLGRLGDMLGRVRIYNIGFVIYTVASLLLTVDWLTGRAGADYLIVFRIAQGVGGACLLANSAAILTDAFPANQRGMALGINNIVGVSGMFIGLLLGGLLAPINWRLVFLISVPVGLFGTVWAYLKLEERSEPRPPAGRLVGERPVRRRAGLPDGRDHVRHQAIRRTQHRLEQPASDRTARRGSGVPGCVRDRRAPGGRSDVPPDRCSGSGRLRSARSSTFLSAVARGGLMFILIIWLQGIWLPQHGYDYTNTPLWAGIYMLPLTVGMLIAGPTSGYLSDHFGARAFATGGMIGAAISFGLLLLLPINFSYPELALVLALNGISMGMFASPNRAAVMNSLPRGDRGAGGGMNQTFQNSAQVISIGIFFTLMIAGLSSSLPAAMSAGLQAHGVGAATAERVAHLPPVAILFAAFLGYNPIQHLLGAHALAAISAHSRAVLTGPAFFPSLISGPFRTGLREAFVFAIVACLVAAAASLMRGGRYYSEEVSPRVRAGGRSGGQVLTAPQPEEQHAR